MPDLTSPDPNAVPSPGPTPSGYQRTTGGKFRWQPPPVEKLQSLLSGYEVTSLVGHGGMGAVYRARQKSLDRLVAVKILPPEAAEDDPTFAERFKNEARTLARLNHPGIVHVHDFGETADGQLYIVMEFVEGTDVQQMLMDHKVLTPQYALPITAHVCDALHYAHTHGVVHRDIKPANIMLTNEGQVKVADFGLAKLDDAGASSLTQTNMSMGTPDYVAPETLTIGVTVDHRADLYAVGVMLYHMLVGEVPRGAFDLPSKRNAALDPRIDAIVMRAMKQNRDERYQTAAEIRVDLDAILAAPEVKPGGEPSSVISKRVVVQSQKNFARTAPAPVKAGGKKEPGATAAPQPGTPEKPGGLAWIVPTGISAVVILGGAFFMRGQKHNEPPREDAIEIKSQASATAPIKVADYKKPPPDAASGPPVLDARKWTAFDPKLDFAVVKEGVTEKDSAFTIVGGASKRLRVNWPHRDIAARAHITIPKGGSGIIGLRGDYKRSGVRAAIVEGGIRIQREIIEGDQSRVQDIRDFPGESAAFFDKGATLAFAVRGDDLFLWVNERYLGSVHEPPAAEGKIVFDGRNPTFRELQWQAFGNFTPKRDIIALVPGNWTPVRFPGDKPPKGGWKDGALILPQRDQCRLPNAFTGRDAAIRAKITVPSGDGSYKGLYFKLRNDMAVGFFNLGDPRTANIGIQPDHTKDLVIVANSAKDAFPLGKKDLLVEFAAVGDDMILAIEGKTAATARSSVQPSGNRAKPPFLALVQAGWNTATFRDLEFVSLDGVPPEKHPDFIKAARNKPVLVAAASSAAPPASSVQVAPAAAMIPASAPKAPAELAALQTQYAAAIAERVTTPHDTSIAQLNTGFLGALDRTVAARQIPPGVILADKKAIAEKQSLPPDTDATPDPLKSLRATYRTKSAEIDDTRTTAHLSLLTPYVARLRELESDLTKAGRTTDAEAVKAYRESLGENPFALPQTRP